ncbi:MAG: TetR/AcrR family transcriptional regulator [Lachnospiraceae bacterium]|nr:TetR/AcrR family transcriptional regulator [Lachnospiraceae bacterium]
MAVQSTKDKLLDAAVNLFSEKGYDGTSVDEIAASIGIKGPTLYKHFKGKEALLTAIMERTDHEYEKGMGIRTQKAMEIHSGEALKAFSMHQILFTLNNENVRKMRRLFTIEQYRNAGFAKRATRHQIKNMQEQFIQIFKRMMDAGEMRREDPEMLALEYIAPTTLMIQMCDREPEKMEEGIGIIEKHIDMFVEKYCYPVKGGKTPD